MRWTAVKKTADQFLVATEDIPRGADISVVYNRWLDSLSGSFRVRNPENIVRVLKYLDENKEVLWDRQKKESHRLAAQYDRKYEMENHIS